MRAASPIAAALAVALAACARDPNGMNEQARYRPYGHSAYWPDGREMRPLVAGTVSREQPRGPKGYLTGKEDGRELDHVPVPLTRDLVEKGRHDFEIYCAACHGLLGDGHSQIAAKMAMRLPPSLIDHRFSPGHLFVVMTEGFGLMASYAEDIPVDHRWGVAAYVEALRRSQNVPLEDVPPEIRAQLTAARRSR